VRCPGRSDRGRVRRGRSKKLRRAFRWHEARQGAEEFDEWVEALIEESPDEDWLGDWLGAQSEADFEPRDWHGLYFRAWSAMRFERQYGAFGGETPIGYLALLRYAEAESIGPDDWPTFHQFMTIIDDEWLAIAAERRKAEQRGSST